MIPDKEKEKQERLQPILAFGEQPIVDKEEVFIPTNCLRQHLCVQFVEEALACIFQDERPGDDGSTSTGLSMSERYFRNGETPVWLGSSEISFDELQGRGVLPSTTGSVVKLTFPRHFEDAILAIMCMATSESAC